VTDTSAVPHRSGLSRLYHGETEIEFIARWKLWFAVSGAVILIGLIALVTQGLNLGIDFEGGNVWQVRAGDASVSQVEDSIADLGLTDVEVQSLRSANGDTTFRVQAASFSGSDAENSEKNQEVLDALAEVTGTSSNDVEVNTVGPSWGEEVSSKAQRALIVFLIAIGLYITARFEFRMAVGTLAALVHDILVVVGVYAVTGLPVTPATVIAILTILGFSIYDGIVVFDRVDENTRLLSTSGRMTYSDMVNLSLNQVLMRSLNTSITAILPVLSVLVIGAFVLGATTLEEFGVALLIGVLSGAYSSLFIASPLLALLKEREPRYAALRRRLEEKEQKAASRKGPATRAEAEAALEAGSDEPAETAPAPSRTATATKAKPTRSAAAGTTKRPATATAIPPRPRKKGKKR
jgi:preprotein translocase subunit SecF